MENNFDKCVSYTFKYEGGYSNDPNDKGGPTNYGITIGDARKYWKANATAADVKAMPRAVAYGIYKTKYWKTPYYNCDTLPPGMDLQVFDTGVLSGPSLANRLLAQCNEPTIEANIRKYGQLRRQYLRSLRDAVHFGAGWDRRAVDCTNKAVDMFKNTPPIVKHAPAAGTSMLAIGMAWLATHRWEAALIAGGVVVGAYLLYKFLKR